MGAGAFSQRLPEWIAEMRRVANDHPATGACTVATALELWSWTATHGGAGSPEEQQARQMALADALGCLLGSRALVMQTVGGSDAALADVCHAQVAHACGEAARLCAQVVFGSLRHPAWESDGQACYRAEDLDALEEYVPGLASTARAYTDVIEADGSHQLKAGPCVRCDSVEEFARLRAKLDGCLAGAQIARVRAAGALG